MNKIINLNSIVEHINKTVPREKQSQAKLLLLLSILKKKAKNNGFEKKDEVIGVDKIEAHEEVEGVISLLEKETDKKKLVTDEPTIKSNINNVIVNVYPVANVEQCASENVNIDANPESVVCNFPVILAQDKIEVYLETITSFSEEVFTIEDIDKNLTIISCDLIPKTNKVFIEGAIEEKIKYTTVNEIGREKISGDIKKAVLNIPFKCCEEIGLVRKPKFSSDSKTIKLQSLTTKKMQDNSHDNSSTINNKLNNDVYFNLEDMKISELNKKLENKILENAPNKLSTFKKLKEKTVINFTLSLIQNQNIFIYNEEYEEKNFKDYLEPLI